MTDEELKIKLTAARQALGGETLEKIEIHKENLTAEQREAAARAMEGPEFKAKREAEKRATAQRELARRIHEEEMRRQQENERRQAEEKHQLEMAREEAEAIERETRQQLAAQSEKVIDQLRRTSAISIQPIKTLKSDLTDAIKDRRVTLSQIVTQKSGRTEESPAEKKSKTYAGTTFAIIASVIFIASGLLLGGWAISRYHQKISSTGTIQPLPGAFFADEFLNIPLDGAITTVTATQKFRTTVNNGGSRESTIISLTPTTNSTALNLEQFVDKLGLNLSIPFVAKIDPAFFLGTHKEKTGQRTLWYVFTVKDYEQTLASMLDDEYDIFHSLFGPVWTPKILAIARDVKFQNSVTANQTSREVRSAEGQVVAVWGFIGREILVLAGSDKAFQAITERLGLPESLPDR